MRTQQRRGEISANSLTVQFRVAGILSYLYCKCTFRLCVFPAFIVWSPHAEIILDYTVNAVALCTCRQTGVVKE